MKLLRAADIEEQQQQISKVVLGINTRQTSSAESDSSHDEFLSLEHGVLLQHLKVVFLIRGMLVNHEDVTVEFGDNEAQVELADDLHLFEHVFTVKVKINTMSFSWEKKQQL